MEKPPKSSLVELALVAVAYVFALVAPSFVVSPSDTSASGTRIAVATGLTVIGALAGSAVAMIAYRRTRNFSWLVIGSVPALTLIILAVIMAGTKSG
jgi:hypothetical protein